MNTRGERVAVIVRTENRIDRSLYKYMNFKQLGIDESILRALNEMGYINPTPIQQKAIAPIKAGKDLLCCANEDLGKTIAFAVPMLQKMGKPESLDDRPIKSIVLAPNRQSAMQIYGNICQCGRYMGRIAAVIYNGVSEIPQVEAINRGADILVATPLRLTQFLEKNLVRLDKVEYLVVCDTDKMLERGLLNDIKNIKFKLPKRHQTLIFTENLSSEIRAFAQKMLYRPFRIDMSIKKRRTTIAAARVTNREQTKNKRKIEKTKYQIDKQEKTHGQSSVEIRKTARIHDEFKMDISTPRTAKLSEEAAARIRAKVQAKLKEREEVRRKANRANKANNIINKKTEENKKTIRRYNRTRCRGNRKQTTKE